MIPTVSALELCRWVEAGHPPFPAQYPYTVSAVALYNPDGADDYLIATSTDDWYYLEPEPVPTQEPFRLSEVVETSLV